VQGIETITPGLLLGFASGATCLATCAPVLIPLFLGEASAPRKNSILLVEFLGGRLCGYLFFGCAAWSAGRFVFNGAALGARSTGYVTLGLGALMLAYGLLKFTSLRQSPGGAAAKSHTQCLVSPWRARWWLRDCPRLIPAALGLASGLNICPPFVVALSQGATSRSLAGSLLFFVSFFAGTSLFFVPVPFVGAFRRHQALTHAGALAAILVGLYYLYSGALHLLISAT
jgi:hypothetical protein